MDILNHLLTISIKVNIDPVPMRMCTQRQGIGYEKASCNEGLLELALGSRLGQHRQRWLILA
jgi:hypothetical protein